MSAQLKQQQQQRQHPQQDEAGSSSPQQSNSKKPSPSSSLSKDDLVQDSRSLRLRHLHKVTSLRVLMFVYDALNVIRQRPSPNPKTKTKHLRLITILYSHYCEKGRWALDLLENDADSPYYYTEDCHPPGFHYLETIRAGNDQGSATPLVIESDSGRAIRNSKDIVRELLPELYPTDEVYKLEDEYNQELGAALRIWLYDLVLTKEFWPILVSVSRYGCAWIEHALFPYMYKMMNAGIRRDLRITPESVALSEQTLRSVFEQASKRLETRPFLAGNSFTAADLTFCALASPLLRPPELAKFHCRQADLPPRALELMHELRATKAGQHVLKVYQTHRQHGVVVNVEKKEDHGAKKQDTTDHLVEVRFANRNRFSLWVAVGVATAAVVVSFGVALFVKPKQQDRVLA